MTEGRLQDKAAEPNVFYYGGDFFRHEKKEVPRL